MPFRQDGASTDSTTFAQIGYALPAAHLIVEPDKLVTLVRGIEDERKRVRDWIDHNYDRLLGLPAPGADPCSEHAVAELGRNGEAAVLAARGYVNRLSEVAEGLGEIARSYRLMEDENVTKFETCVVGPK